MSTKMQFIGTLALAVAFVAASVAMPETADAWWGWKKPGRGAPEVDPSTLSSAVALAMGGLAVLRDKLRR